MLIAAAFMVGAIIVVYLFFQLSKTQAEDSLRANTQKAASYSAVQSAATSFRSDLASAKQILSGTTNYPQMMINISRLLPKGVVLQQLTLDSTTFDKPSTLLASAKTYADTLALKNSLQASPMFTDVSIQSVTDAETGAYPITATLTVTLNKDAIL